MGKQYVLSNNRQTTSACNASFLVPLKLGMMHSVIITN